MRKILTLVLSACLLTAGLAQNGTPRKYDRSGTVELEKVYHVDLTKDKTLRALGYTEAMLPDTFPAFTEYWRMHGWPRAEMLDLYLFECAWNDVIYGTDGYYGRGFYIRGNYVSQSRAHIVAPTGKYHVRYGCLTALGMYSGGQAQVSSDATGTLLGGTAIEIDHFGWSTRTADRVCLQSTVWGKDYSQVGGIAYQEGVMVEFFRFMGDRPNCPAGVFTTGVTLNEPGEQSAIRFCMSENFAGAGYTIFNGTPFVVETCSAFNNTGPGFDLLGSNGLCNVRFETPSGDNNLALIRIRPKDAQSVGGGTITVRNLKSETRASESGGKPQIPILIEGFMGDLNLGVDGMTADFIGVTCPYLIGGNWTGTQFEINVRGLDLRSGVEALAKSATATVTGGKQFSGNSFVWNDEGLAFKSRSNMVLSTGTTPPTYTGTWSAGSWGTCTGGTQTRTVTCSNTNCDPSTKPAESQACGTPPPTGTLTAKASHTGTEGGTLREARYMVDGNTGTFWISGRSMTATGDQWIVIDRGSSRSTSGITFGCGYYVNSYPRSFTVETSTDGSTWTARGSFTGAVSSVATFPAVTVQYLRIKCTTANSNWWSVNELSVQ